MFREKIKVLDCTIRDGGLINDHDFDDRFVREVYKAVSSAGVDYMEIGYKNSHKLFSSEKYGKWKFCSDDDINQIIDGIETRTKISVMVDVDRVDVAEIKPKKDSPVSMIRVATYAKDIDKAIALVNNFHDKGYETTVNIMAVSKTLETELNEALQQLEKESKADVVYVVDSFGALYQESIEYLVKKYQSILKSKELGIHTHNNQQLAFGNTIEAIIHNVNYLDASVYGIGRAAGNCPLELLIGFLKNPKYDIRPILDVISQEFIPLRQKLEWGYIIPYAIAGMMDEHPKAAMALRDSEKKENYREFYESLVGSDLSCPFRRIFPMNLKDFKKLPVMGIMRGVEDIHIEPLFECIISSGLKTVEITMNTAGASGLIRKALKVSRGRLTIGAGTVTSKEILKDALDAGASFIVMPVLVREVAEACVKENIPVFPGALTPQEIFNAWNAGASMVKVFPAKFFGPEYFKEVKGPFNNVELLACGGVTPENIKDYLSNGASAVAFGGSVFKKEALSAGNYRAIEGSIKKFLQPFNKII